MVYPSEPEMAVFEKMPPLGMLWMGGALRRAGHEVHFLDQQVDDRDPAELAGRLRPGLALIGGTSHSRFASFRAARSIKQASPSTAVALRGPHASFTAEDTLAHVPSIDIVAHGEGEATAVELAEWAEGTGRIRRNSIASGDLLPPPRGCGPHRVPASHRGSRLARTARSQPGAVLPLFHGNGLSGHTGASILTTRGCPICCSFCSAAAMFGHSYRHRSAEAVVDEIERLVREHGAQGIKIFDSTFTLNRAHVRQVCELLLRRNLKIPWNARSGPTRRPRAASPHARGRLLLHRRRHRIRIPAGLDECIGKGIRLEEAVEVLRAARELGLRVKAFFTLDIPEKPWPTPVRPIGSSGATGAISTSSPITPASASIRAPRSRPSPGARISWAPTSAGRSLSGTPPTRGCYGRRITFRFCSSPDLAWSRCAACAFSSWPCA